MKYQVGERLTGTINNITALGIFVTLPGRHSGLVHHSDFGNNWPQARHQHRVGQEVRVVITHRHRGRLALSMMRVNDPRLLDPTNQFSKTAPADFRRVLNQTVHDAQAEIAQLKKVLTKTNA